MDGDGAAGGGHPGHLAQRPGPVGEEHQGRLAEDGVEGAGLERQLGRVALGATRSRCEPAGHGQHALVEVEADHPALAAHPARRPSGPPPRCRRPRRARPGRGRRRPPRPGGAPTRRRSLGRTWPRTPPPPPPRAGRSPPNRSSRTSWVTPLVRPHHPSANVPSTGQLPYSGASVGGHTWCYDRGGGPGRRARRPGGRALGGGTRRLRGRPGRTGDPGGPGRGWQSALWWLGEIRDSVANTERAYAEFRRAGDAASAGWWPP